MLKKAKSASSLPRIDESYLWQLLRENRRPDSRSVEEVIARGEALQGLSLAEAARLVQVEEPHLLQRMFQAAQRVMQEIYGRRLVIFAPLYYSSFCCNNCLYCSFRRDNPAPRRRLTLDEVREQTRLLVEQGHKRLLVIAGEEHSPEAFEDLLQVISTVYATRSGRGEIRRVNVEMAPMTVEQFGRLKETGIGTYVVFQETYHRGTYARMHPSGPKADYDWRLGAMDRAMQAGIDDVGIGVLFGLHDWRFEVLALLAHAQHLEQAFGCGPHTISVPRVEPAAGAPLSESPPAPVSDEELKKIVAVLRLAVPYTGIILSTREPAPLRDQLFRIGISQISAGSRTEPGGYSEAQERSVAQFSIHDQRSLDEVVRDVAAASYIPSFCTGCYRLGRTGQDFMALAKPGAIRQHCAPNALSTFAEYLDDYASAPTREVGMRAIAEQLAEMEPAARRRAERLVERVRSGERDAFC